jgi:hypothetical protein
MARPKNEDGKTVEAAHRRIAGAHQLEQLAVFKLSEDGRLSHLPMKRELALARKAIDTAIDGAERPKGIYVKVAGAGAVVGEGFDAMIAAVSAAVRDNPALAEWEGKPE